MIQIINPNEFLNLKKGYELLNFRYTIGDSVAPVYITMTNGEVERTINYHPYGEGTATEVIEEQVEKHFKKSFDLTNFNEDDEDDNCRLLDEIIEWIKDCQDDF